jgi:hypothetical protein
LIPSGLLRLLNWELEHQALSYKMRGHLLVRAPLAMSTPGFLLVVLWIRSTCQKAWQVWVILFLWSGIGNELGLDWQGTLPNSLKLRTIKGLFDLKLENVKKQDSD